MHPYIPHLLADIQAAHKSEEPKAEEHAPSSIEEELEEVERWVAGEEREQTLGDYCRLQRSDFPPAEHLSDEDLALVCKAFEDLLSSWNSGIDLPANIPPRLRYTLTVGTLEEVFTPVHYGHISFDFCSGYAPGCPLKEYCPCLDIWNDAAQGET